jgi:hypothetical protein
MSFLSKTLGYVPREERDGIYLDSEIFWDVEAAKDTITFLKSIPLISPEGSNLYLEGINSEQLKQFLADNGAAQVCRVAVQQYGRDQISTISK